MKHLPNLLTILRIVLTPVVLVLLLTRTFEGQLAGTILFVLAGLSDWLDGRLARAYGVKSRLGQFLDPIADKVLVLGMLGVFVALVPIFADWWWVIALIAVRDIVVTGLRIRAEWKHEPVQTLALAQAKTYAQYVFILVILALILSTHAGGAWGQKSAHLLAGVLPLVLLGVILGLTLYSGWQYIRPAPST